jgi:2-keto-4-pentenoate hydratase/2-oxohepta-3-ene-1,7-dioic acid hydratase in catechol pathway
VTCHLPHGGAIRRPAGYDGQIVFEGELGIVIGRRCANVTEDTARDCIFGYTCVNDVTARDLLKADPSFPQWTRAKGFDTFGAFGPAICRGMDPGDLVVRTFVDGVEKQNYPVADMFFAPHEIVSRISRDTTLEPGDLIACGTSLGAGAIPPGSLVEIEIAGIGRLANRLAVD